MRAIHSLRHRWRLALLIAVMVMAMSPPPVAAVTSTSPNASTSGDVAPMGAGVAPLPALPKGKTACPAAPGKPNGPGAACTDSATAPDSTPGRVSLPKGSTQCPTVNGKESGVGAACASRPAPPSGAPAGADIVSLPQGTARCPNYNGKQSSPYATCNTQLAGARANSALTPLPNLVAGWSVSISSSATYIGVNHGITLSASSNQDVGPTIYWIEIYNQTSGTLLNACGSGTSCSASFNEGTTTTQGFVAYVAGYSNTTPPPTVAAVSGTAYTTWISINSLTASPQYLAPTQKTTITVTASVNVGPTPYYLELFDATTGANIAICSTGTSCSASVQQNSATVHLFSGYISYYGTTNAPPGVQSGTSVYAFWMSVSISASPYAVGPGGTTTLTATTNADVGPSPYYISIFDGTTGARVTYCGAGTSCSGSYTVSGSAVRDFWAYVGGNGTTAPPAPFLTSSANYAEVTWMSVQLVVSPPLLSPTAATQLTASASMSVYNTAYFIAIFDQSTASFVTECGNGSTCATSVSESSPTSQTFIAFISGGSTSYPPANIRAQSLPGTASWITLNLRACNYSVPSCPSGSRTNGTAVNGPLTFTAVTQVSIGSGYSIQIIDPSGAVKASCTSVSSCSATASEASAGTFVFGAQVAIPSPPPETIAAYANTVSEKWVQAWKPWPATTINDSYDYSDGYAQGVQEFGVDVPFAPGTAIKAPESGTIAAFQPCSTLTPPCWMPGRVLVKLDSGATIGFGHVNLASKIKVGQRVAGGVTIATVGCFPDTTKPLPNCYGSHTEFMYDYTNGDTGNIWNFMPPPTVSPVNGCPHHTWTASGGNSIDPCAWLSAYLAYGS